MYLRAFHPLTSTDLRGFVFAVATAIPATLIGDGARGATGPEIVPEQFASAQRRSWFDFWRRVRANTSGR